LGGFFGVISKNDCVSDLFFGVDYHSHLGTRRGGMAVYSKQDGFQRAIHNIENAPFRTKFENDIAEMRGASGIGCISDSDPQPLMVRSHLGNYALSTVGLINNESRLCKEVFEKGGHFLEMSGGRINATELVASLINQQGDFVSGIRWAQEKIDGSMSILLLTQDALYAARDLKGRMPLLLGRREDGVCASFESFAYQKLGYVDERDLGPGEIVRITPEEITVEAPALEKMRICAFLWTYYGYPNSHYEGVTVENMRYRCGGILAQHDLDEGLCEGIDMVAGVPDSGTPHAIGYANRSHIPFGRPLIKYTPTWPRSFMPTHQTMRDLVARMKMVPVPDLIDQKRLLFIDDSIVRGTQMRETIEFLYQSGAREVHFRTACPPLLYSCKYLNFSRNGSNASLITNRTIARLEGEAGFQHLEEYADRRTERGQAMLNSICEELHFTSLRYQTVEGLAEAIGISPCKLCTYCWTGKE